MKRFSVNFSSRIEPEREINSEFTLCKCYVMAIGKNSNMSHFSKDVVNAHLNTLEYCPVVAHLLKDENGSYRLGGHDFTIDNEFNLVPLTVPFGVVKADSFGYETIEEYGTDVEYLTASVILWTGRYPELKEAIYDENTWFNQSMEVNADQYRPLECDSNYIDILDFEFSALCLLNKSDDRNKNVAPCFINSKVQPYTFESNESFKNSINEMRKAIAECFEKEGKSLDNAEKTKNTNETEPVAKTFTISQYQLTANEKRNKISDAVSKMNVVTDSSDTWYWLDDYDDNYVYLEKNVYNYENDNHIRQVGRCSYNISEDGNVAITSEFEEMRVMWLTINEAKNIEEARDNYSLVKAENAELLSYKAQFEAMNRKKAEDEVFAKYDRCIGKMAEYAELKSKASNYSIEELNKSCLILMGQFALANNVKETDAKHMPETLRFSVDTSINANNRDNPYGDVFSKYGNK